MIVQIISVIICVESVSPCSPSLFVYIQCIHCPAKVYRLILHTLLPMQGNKASAVAQNTLLFALLYGLVHMPLDTCSNDYIYCFTDRDLYACVANLW